MHPLLHSTSGSAVTQRDERPLLSHQAVGRPSSAQLQRPTPPPAGGCAVLSAPQAVVGPGFESLAKVAPRALRGERSWDGTNSPDSQTFWFLGVMGLTRPLSEVLTVDPPPREGLPGALRLADLTEKPTGSPG